MKTLLMSALLLCGSCLCLAQEKTLLYFRIEAGGDAIVGPVKNLDYIRAEMTDYSGEVTADLYGSALSSYIGAAVEIRSRNGKFAYSSGLRYKRINGLLGRPYFRSTTNEYFYFIAGQTDNSTEYFRVNDISQKSNYLGLAADARIFPFGRHRFTVYFKGGLEFDFLLKTKTEANFVNKGMEQYNNEVAKKVLAPSDVTVMLHTATGVEFGKNSKCPLRFEMGPSVFLTQNASGFMKTNGAFNLMVSVQVPF